MLNELAPDIAEHGADDKALQDESIEPRSLTVLTGAGASLHAGAPTSAALTDIFAAREISGAILQALCDNHEDSDEINFEDALHVLEELELFADPRGQSRAIRSLKPFMVPKGCLGGMEGDWAVLRRERLEVMEQIGARVSELRYGDWPTLYKWLRPFIEHYDLSWYTLNYDVLSDVVMYALSVRTAKGKWFDGFGGRIDMDGSERFRPDWYANPESCGLDPVHFSLAHLHGSVLYAYRTSDPRLAHHLGYELVRATSLKVSTTNWAMFHGRALSDPEMDFGPVSPIISGLRKSDKLNVRPYGNYLHGFADSLSSTPYLLIIGYGGADPHINYWLREFIDIHTRNARVVEINLIDKPELSAVAKLGSYDLRWESIGDGIYRNYMGVNTLLIATGIGGESDVPSSLMLRFLDWKGG